MPNHGVRYLFDEGHIRDFIASGEEDEVIKAVIGEHNVYQVRPDLQADGNAIATTTQQLSGAVGTAISAAVVAIFQHGATDFAAATYAGTEADFIIFLVLAVVHNVTIRLALKKAGPVPQK
jgi:hypothetical protein